MIPLEIGAIVSVVGTIPVVTIPDGVVIIGVTGKFVLVGDAGGRRIPILVYGSGCILILVNGGRSLIDDGCGSGIDPYMGYPKPDASVDIYL
jgi:hypothetical protein